MTELGKLERTRAFLERVNDRVIAQNNDRVVLVVGDEGVGKSTFMCQLALLWNDTRGRDTDAESVLENICWGGREAFKERLEQGSEGDMIAVQDAPHVLFSRDVMKGEQKELERTLMDIRFKNYLIVLGFQDWSDIPSGLKQRRAKNTFRISTRGVARAYNREGMDKKYKHGEWRDELFMDRFDSLEGTDLWEQFQARDEQAKLDRLEESQDDEPEDVRWQEQCKVALRAVRPWEGRGEGMTQEAAAALIDKSQTWVARRKREWERGHHRDLLADDPTVPTNERSGENRQREAG
jgi:energy-coupling factor transporter ATP-binding protein EcfA2